MEEPWKTQLNQCLDEAEAVSRPWGSSVREEIFDHRKAKFKQKEPDWKTHGATVLKNSKLAGIVARACADFEKPGSEVTADHMKAGIAAAHKVCQARVAGADVAIRLFWCE